jgi:hypothetical protein
VRFCSGWTLKRLDNIAQSGDGDGNALAFNEKF